MEEGSFSTAPRAGNTNRVSGLAASVFENSRKPASKVGVTKLIIFKIGLVYVAGKQWFV